MYMKKEIKHKQTRFRKNKKRNRNVTKRRRLRLNAIKLTNTPKMVTFGELNLDDETRKLDKNTIIVGIIYAKWCPHCKDLIPDENDKTTEPKWDKMIDLIKADAKGRDVAYLKIEDGEVGKLDKLNYKCKHLCKTPVASEGFPTLFKITGGNWQKYTGERTPAVMAKWFLDKNYD
uniref:Thioredoxin domain-containing protein n=1 Tax=viral metagenome TaxID=1070528 RepID=A0A6C0F2T0_9ZZZZ